MRMKRTVLSAYDLSVMDRADEILGNTYRSEQEVETTAAFPLTIPSARVCCTDHIRLKSSIL